MRERSLLSENTGDMSTIDGATRAPRVFVSYSHDSREHMDRVLALCDRLRREGVEAELDQYEPVPREGWPRWTARKVEQADFVLIVCTETYRRRFDGHEEVGKGSGVHWEGSRVFQALYDAGAQNDKFLPVLFSPADEAHIPWVLRGTTHFVVSDKEGYEQLHRYLTAQPAVPPSELGPRRAWPLWPRKTDFTSSSEHPVRRFHWKWGAGAAVLLIALGSTVALFSTGKNGHPGETPKGSVPAPRPVLRGEILDAETKAPLAGVEIQLPEYRLEQTTGKDGQYQFKIPKPGVTSIKVRATKAGYRALNLDLPPGDHLNPHQMWRIP